MPMAASTVVVGGGLSGLAAAYRLQEAGHDVVVLERAPIAGGCARSEHRAGYLVDTGCDLINGTFARYLALVRELGLGDRLVRSSQIVDIVRDGRPVTVDRSRPWSLVRNPIVSLAGKLALARGYVRLRAKISALDPYALTAHAGADYGTAHDLCLRYFNEEVTEYLVDPVLRAFAGTGTRNASGLSVLAALAVGTKDAYAIEGGMAAVPGALAQRLDVRCCADVCSIDDEISGVTVSYHDGDGRSAQLRADTCVLAVSYHDALAIWPALGEAAGEFGQQLKDVPLMSISLGYEAPSPTDAYAVLVPTSESDEVLLVMMQQNKAPDRAPAGRTLVTIFTEALATTRLMGRSDEQLIGWASGFIESRYPQLRGHRDQAIVTRWPHTGYWPFPGYWKGIAGVRERLPKQRVHITSSLFGSGGIERAVLGGERAAGRVLRAKTGHRVSAIGRSAP
jgi:oxygen-dependent protoporphyrinogen oxidase